MKTDFEGTVYDDVHLVCVVEGTVEFWEPKNTVMYSGFLARQKISGLAEDRLPSCKNGCAPYYWFTHSMERVSRSCVFDDN